jgi:GAF domain-containing protein
MLLAWCLTASDRFKNCPLAVNHGVRFYAGTNLQIEDGTTFGTLCVMSTTPRASFPVKDQATLVSLARTISLMVRRERRALNGAPEPEHVISLPTVLSADDAPPAEQ